MRPISGGFSRFRNAGRVTLQTVTHGRRQSFGAAERRHMYFKEILHRITDNRKNRQIRPVDRQEYDALSTLRNYIRERNDTTGLRPENELGGERLKGRSGGR